MARDAASPAISDRQPKAAPIAAGARAPSSAEPPSPGLARHARGPRIVACVLGAIAIGAGLWLHAAPPWCWGLLALQTIGWPAIAHRLATARGDGAPRADDSTQARLGVAEIRNMLIDGLLCGFWLPAIRFEPITSLALLSVPWVNAVGVGGPRLLARTVLAQAAGVLAGALASGVHPAATLTLVPFLSSAPLGIAYPLLLAHLHHRLQQRLADRKRALQHSEQLHRDTLDALHAGIVLWDAEDRFVLCNAEFRRQNGQFAALLQPGGSFEDLMRHVVWSGLVPDAVGHEEAWMAERLALHRQPGVPIEREYADGQWQLIAEKRLPDGGTISFTHDVTALMRTRAELAEARTEAERARTRLEDAIEALPDAFALFDAEDRLLAWNSTYLQAYAESAAAAHVGAPFEQMLRAGLACGQYPDAVGREEAWLADRLEHHRHPTRPLLQQLPGNRWMRINERPTREGGSAGTRTDVTDLVRREQELQLLITERDAYEARLRDANDQLERLSTTDSLTGLGNRRLLDRRIAEEWQRARRHRLPLALLIVDIDHFKAYNDCYGHPEGDRCLQRVATVLREAVHRSGDVVARYGGEEFALLLPHTTHDQALATAERCRAGLAAAAIPHARSPIAAHVTVSIGIAIAHVDGEEAEGTQEDLAAFVQRADQALYAGKRSGRNRIMG